MADSSQTTPIFPQFSIQSIISSDDHNGTYRQRETTGRCNSTSRRTFDPPTPNFTSPLGDQSSPGTFRPEPVAIPPPATFKPLQNPPINPPITSMLSRDVSGNFRQKPFVWSERASVSSVFIPQPLSCHQDHREQFYSPYRQQQHQQQQQQQQQQQLGVPRINPLPTSDGVAIVVSGNCGGGMRDGHDQGYPAPHVHEYGYLSLTAGRPDTPVVTEGKRGTAIIKRQPMRSSIACARCRRSKIKCVNNGDAKAACETCLKSRRECRYPDPSSPMQRPDTELQFVVNTPSTPRNTSSSKRGDGHVERQHDRKRLKKLDDTLRLDSQASGAYFANEVLSAPYLTETMWTEIFDIYRLHFATELPFLHIPTLKHNLGSQARRSANTNLVLLGVLTLTSRFHSDLVKYIAYSLAGPNNRKIRQTGPLKSDPWAASEYYADTLTKALGPLRSSMTLASVERVQAFLMLGLYEWSQSKTKSGGLGAWMYVGVAIRMAQALGLCFERVPSHIKHRAAATARLSTPTSTAEMQADTALRSSLTNHEDSTDPESSKDTIVMEQEVCRRTMFSCLVLDRMLACGDDRLPAIRSEDLKIQLPCPDSFFDLSQKVKTGYLKPISAIIRDADNGTSIQPSNDSVLARFILLVDLWGEISRYSFTGGRATEKQPPWEESTFRRLREELDDFYSNLPAAFTLSASNYHKHENQQASSAYVSLHMLGAVCQIMLHREYIPFIPIRCKGPMGPLDAPTFLEESAPVGFWEESADQVFKAAHDIVYLIEICQARKKLPMSTLVVFAIWMAAFVGIYAWHFPQLDVRRRMSLEQDNGSNSADHHNITLNGPTSMAFSALTNMSKWLNLASVYVKYFKEMDNYYKDVIKDYWKQVNRHGGDTTGQKSVRQGGDGGGLDEWRVHGSKITNNGTIISSEDVLAEVSDLSRASSIHSGPGPAPDAGAQHQYANSCECDGMKGNSSGNHSRSNTSIVEEASTLRSNVALADERSTRIPVCLAPGSSFVAPASAPARGTLRVNGIVNDSGSGLAGGTAAVVDNTTSPRRANESTASSSLPVFGAAEDPQLMLYHIQRPGFGTYMQPPINQAQQGSLLVSSPRASGYYDDAPSTFSDMNGYYAVAGVEQYVDKYQGKRWQDASQATHIGQFAHGDSDGPAIWSSSCYSTLLSFDDPVLDEPNKGL